MLIGIARLIAVIAVAWVAVRSPLRSGVHLISRGARIISDRQLVMMCAIMAAVLALGVLFQRFC